MSVSLWGKKKKQDAVSSLVPHDLPPLRQGQAPAAVSVPSPNMPLGSGVLHVTPFTSCQAHACPSGLLLPGDGILQRKGRMDLAPLALHMDSGPTPGC